MNQRVFWRAAAICISTLRSRSAATSGRRGFRFTSTSIITSFGRVAAVRGGGFLLQANNPTILRRSTTTRRHQRTTTSSRKMSDSKLDSPSAERNKEPIWQAIKDDVLPNLDGRLESVLEIAAGTGIHALYFAKKLLQQTDHISRSNSLRWQPADADPRYRESIRAYMDEEVDPALKGVIPMPLALTLDASGIVEWDTREFLKNGKRFDLLVCINMIHIAPIGALHGLMKVAGGNGEQKPLLRRGGLLLLYGPFKVGGTCVESNQNFDASLRRRDPRMGLRDLEQVREVAERNGLELVQTREMPANNLVVLFRRKP